MSEASTGAEQRRGLAVGVTAGRRLPLMAATVGEGEQQGAEERRATGLQSAELR